MLRPDDKLSIKASNFSIKKLVLINCCAFLKDRVKENKLTIAVLVFMLSGQERYSPGSAEAIKKPFIKHLKFLKSNQ
jgi:hypothetical protein